MFRRNRKKGKGNKKSLMPTFLIIGTIGIAIGALLFSGGEGSGIRYIIENVGIISENNHNGQDSNLEDILGSDFLPTEEKTTESTEAALASSGEAVASDDINDGDIDYSGVGSGSAITYGGGTIVSNGTAQQYLSYPKTAVSSPYYSDPGMIALTTSYAYTTVDNSYFNDALFIGDSRTEGLRLYGGLSGATFYSKNGENIYKLMSDKLATNLAGAKVTIPEALRERQFGKIYIMIGINNLGIGNTERHRKEYANILTTIRALQPNAIIYIEANINMTTEYSNRSDYMNNINLNDKNVASAGFANGVDIFYLDVNEVLTDPDRGLKKGTSPDGVHMKASQYALWVNYLKTHAVVR